MKIQGPPEVVRPAAAARPAASAAPPEPRDRVEVGTSSRGTARLRAVGDRIRQAYEGFVSSLKGFPRFLYPAVHGTPEEQRVVMEVLDEMPLHHVSRTGSVRWVDRLPGDKGIVFGQTTSAPGHPIELSRDGLYRSWQPVGEGGSTRLLPDGRLNEPLAGYTIKHELGHAVDFPENAVEWKLAGPRSGRAPWGQGPHATDYAQTDHFEDYAESYAFRHGTPEEIRSQRPGLQQTELEEISREKDRLLREEARPNVLQRLADNKATRGTGKLLGQTLDRVPFSRLALQSLSTTFSVLLVADGAEKLVGAARSRSTVDGVRGALAIGGGVAFLATFVTGLAAPVGLALLGAREGLNRAERRGRVEAAPPPPERPKVGLGQRLKRVARRVSGRPVEPLPRALRPQGARVRDRVGTAAAAVGGGLGGLVGGFGGPLAGIAAGFAVAGPVGGVVGMIAGGLAGFKGGAWLGAEAAMRLSDLARR